MKVLAIAHNCVGASNRGKFDALAAHPDLEITLLTPHWWVEEGQLLRQATPAEEGYRLVVGRTVFTGNGTRHAYLTALPRLMASWQPDVIDLHEEPFSLAAFQTVLLRDLLAPRAALILCSYVNVDRRWRSPYRWFEQYTLKRADAAYVPSSDVPGVLRAKGLLGPIDVIAMGVDITRFGAAALASRARAAHGPPFVIGFLGRLEPVKGLPVLLNAFCHLSADARLLIVGDGPERPHLGALVGRLGLDGRVELRPAVAFSEVPGFLASLDVLVLPSVTIPPAHREQFGRVLVEAMAAGVPVVGSDSGGIPEVIDQAGIVFPEGNAGALATVLAELQASAGRRRELMERGLRRAQEAFAWPRLALQYRALYELGLAVRQQRSSESPALPRRRAGL